MVDYNGTISEVKPGDQIVTVQVPDTAEAVDPGSVDLMFTDTTRVLNVSYMEMPFDSLRVDQQVRVEAQQQGDRQVPIRLTILN
jgi:hypothetical protein